jgi:Flp pilus assembly pilin Flp
MKRLLLKRLWRDVDGGVEYISLILITAVVAMAGVVGLVQVRNQVTQEFGDAAVALDTLDQSFTYTIQVDTLGNGSFAYTKSAAYADPGPTLTDPADAPPACLVLNVAPGSEGDTPVAPSGAFP